MKSILNLIIEPEYTIIGGHVNLSELCSNPNPKIAKLIVRMKNPNYDSISGNPNPGLTKFIIKNRDKINKSKLMSNTNPLLAGLILELLPIYNNNKELFMNPNPEYTEFSLGYGVSCINYLLRNTNSKLADLIIQETNWYDIRGMSVWDRISGNSNTGLTDFILSRPDNVDYIALSTNTNPLLAELIIKNKHRLNWCAIFSNPNIGLTKFIIKNYISKCATYLGYNTNPDLTDFIISKLKPAEIHSLNTNKKLIKHRMLNSRGYVGLSANPSAVIIGKKIELL